ncbi:divalent metal cation transporter [Desulforhabdus amnigena]|uniref:divalent metal cation transporter n=1 Tax=Desulforhabdus amnigena TaxID=40218 RepID=UPI0016AD23D7|nr:divalent metal cation transporter [Desulforhabdus amnigena]NLJ26456.1 divalent metal cation transporter [Deltaproteobacteria bacterium]
MVKGSYKSVEKVFLFACLFYLAYPITFFLLKLDLKSIGRAMIEPRLDFSGPYLAMVIGLVGTTIAPWMQFYQQASVAEKNISMQDYKYSHLDTIAGCIMVNIVAVCIIVVCALTLHRTGIRIEFATDAARVLKPLAGAGSGYLFGFGLWNASLFAASILPLSTAYTICEALGCPLCQNSCCVRGVLRSAGSPSIFRSPLAAPLLERACAGPLPDDNHPMLPVAPSLPSRRISTKGRKTHLIKL